MSRVWVKQALVEQGMCREQEDSHPADLTRRGSWLQRSGVSFMLLDDFYCDSGHLDSVILLSYCKGFSPHEIRLTSWLVWEML